LPLSAYHLDYFPSTPTTTILTLTLHDALPILYSRQESPRISLARHNAVVVLPTPADPENSRCGISDVFFRRDFRLPIISFWFTMEESLAGLYFSTHMVDSVIGSYLSHLLIKLSLMQN